MNELTVGAIYDLSHQESTTGQRLTDIKLSRPYKSQYYSGQGKMWLAVRDPSGQARAFEPLGNCPEFTIYADGRLTIICEAWQPESWPVLFGGTCIQASSHDVPNKMQPEEWYSQSDNVQCFTLRAQGNASEYYLIFEGVNTANCNARIHCELFRVTFDIASALELISNNISGFPLQGHYHKDESQAHLGGYGRIYVWPTN